MQPLDPQAWQYLSPQEKDLHLQGVIAEQLRQLVIMQHEVIAENRRGAKKVVNMIYWLMVFQLISPLLWYAISRAQYG